MINFETDLEIVRLGAVSLENTVIDHCKSLSLRHDGNLERFNKIEDDIIKQSDQLTKVNDKCMSINFDKNELARQVEELEIKLGSSFIQEELRKKFDIKFSEFEENFGKLEFNTKIKQDLDNLHNMIDRAKILWEEKFLIQTSTVTNLMENESKKMEESLNDLQRKLENATKLENAKKIENQKNLENATKLENPQKSENATNLPKDFEMLYNSPKSDIDRYIQKGNEIFENMKETLFERSMIAIDQLKQEIEKKSIKQNQHFLNVMKELSETTSKLKIDVLREQKYELESFSLKIEAITNKLSKHDEDISSLSKLNNGNMDNISEISKSLSNYKEQKNQSLDDTVASFDQKINTLVDKLVHSKEISISKIHDLEQIMNNYNKIQEAIEGRMSHILTENQENIDKRLYQVRTEILEIVNKTTSELDKKVTINLSNKFDSSSSNLIQVLNDIKMRYNENKEEVTSLKECFNTNENRFNEIINVKFDNFKKEFDDKSDELKNIIQQDLLKNNQAHGNDLRLFQEQNSNLSASLVKIQSFYTQFETSMTVIINENIKTISNRVNKFEIVINDLKQQDIEILLQNKLKSVKDGVDFKLSKLSNKIQIINDNYGTFQETLNTMKNQFSSEYRENLSKRFEKLENNSSIDSRELKGFVQKVEERFQYLERSFSPEFKDKIAKGLAIFESIPKMKKELENKIRIDTEQQFKEKSSDVINTSNKVKEEHHFSLRDEQVPSLFSNISLVSILIIVL